MIQSIDQIRALILPPVALQITMPVINKMNCGCAKGFYCSRTGDLVRGLSEVDPVDPGDEISVAPLQEATDDGLSDRISDAPSLEQRMDYVSAVNGRNRLEASDSFRNFQRVADERSVCCNFTRTGSHI
jgi:hypothetical protein